MAANRRIQKELLEITKNPIENCQIAPIDDNLYKWSGKITAPRDSVYGKAVFNLSIDFPTDYPFKPPKILFQTRIYHPNVDDDGSICMEMLKSDVWKPSTKLLQVFQSLMVLLENPNADDPLRTDIAEIYKTDKKKYEANAKDWVKRHCEDKPKGK